MALTPEEKESILDVVECEGFDYTFQHKTSFDEIQDEMFHRLRKSYLSATYELQRYIGYEDF